MSNITDATAHRGVAIGSCVVIENDEMIYAGPLASAPETDGSLFLLHPHDFSRLKNCWTAADRGEQVGMLS
jgi:hypothetical protein